MSCNGECSCDGCGEYNFDKIVSRKGTCSIKSDYPVTKEIYKGAPEDFVPMWVADMEFETPKVVTTAIRNRSVHPLYGYTDSSMDINSTVIAWQKIRHNISVTEEEIIPFPGVIAALSSCVRALTKKGDGIIIQQPVYSPFSSIPKENERVIVNNPLIKTSGSYDIDFLDLEEKAKDKNNTMMIFCSPHNPVGRVWTEEEVFKVAQICFDNNVILISDEIHNDLILPPNKHVSMGVVPNPHLDNVIILASITKTFNLAGMGLGYAIVKNEDSAEKIKKDKNLFHWSPSIISVEAMKAAYTQEGSIWVDALCDYLCSNFDYIKTFVKINLEKADIADLQGTYLAWVDLNGYKDNFENIDDMMEKLTKEGSLLNNGCDYGEDGKWFIRINFALPLSQLKRGLEKIKNVLI